MTNHDRMSRLYSIFMIVALAISNCDYSLSRRMNDCETCTQRAKLPSTSSHNWYGCNGCCGYVAGASGWSCCKARGALYSSCFNNSDCLVLNSQCILGCCQCPQPTFKQNSCQQCEQVRRSLGSQCSSNSDCSKDIFRGECVNEVCQCQSAFKPACPPNAPCQCVSRVLGDQCAQDQDCTTNIPNSVCSSSTCQCATGYSPNLCRQCVISHQFENAIPQSINALSVPYYTGHFQNLGMFG